MDLLLLLTGISTLLLTLNSVDGDECSALFFTPAWQECFQNKFKRNWKETSFDQRIQFQPLDIPTFEPIMPFTMPMPNMDEIMAEAQAQHGKGQGVPGSSFSSSSFSSSSGLSVMSSNGRTWRVESNGLPVSSSSTSTTATVKVPIGEPDSVQNSLDENKNSVQVDVRYGDGSTKWVKITLDSPTKVKDLLIEKQNGILSITGNM